MFLGILFIFILFLFILPRLLTWLLPILVKRQMRKQFNAFSNAAGGRHNNPYRPKNETKNHAPRAPKKKIPSDVGEYVRFEEVEISESYKETIHKDGSFEAESRISVEEQIVDAEWEEIDYKSNNKNQDA